MTYLHIAAGALLFCSLFEGKEEAHTSWGKPDASFEQYRQDAVECARLGYFRDISQDEPTKQFVRGFRSADDGLNQNDMGGVNIDRWRDTILRTQPDRKRREIQKIQINDVEQCLTARGYRKFALTDRQSTQLSRYSAGSTSRHMFLYQLSLRALARQEIASVPLFDNPRLGRSDW